jgi:predicted AAA+ superfamily ATPase
VTAILGPRQCGKSTLAKELCKTERRPVYFDLEQPSDAQALTEPYAALAPLKGLVVIDEVQRHPDLFPILRVLADRPDHPAKFLVLGSAAPEFLRQTSETLAGRVAFVEMSGFTLAEVGAGEFDRRWLRGGFPRSFLARTDVESWEWREDFIRTFLERDIRQLGFELPAATLRRFWTMVAHYHGQIWNASEIGRSLGVSDTTARRYLDLLGGALVVRALPPWHENLGKRQVKSPKIYVRDSGLAHSLLGIADRKALLGHPKLGASWEGFALEEVLAAQPVRDAYFWATYGGAELDLLVFHRGRRLGYEFKYSDAPTASKSMHVALADLKLDRLWVIYPGVRRYSLGEKIEAIGLVEAAAQLAGEP